MPSSPSACVHFSNKYSIQRYLSVSSFQLMDRLKKIFLDHFLSLVQIKKLL